jgi:hypothetical protein
MLMSLEFKWTVPNLEMGKNITQIQQVEWLDLEN